MENPTVRALRLITGVKFPKTEHCDRANEGSVAEKENAKKEASNRTK
jgi:hypothetical protein